MTAPSLYLHFRALGRPFLWAAYFSPQRSHGSAAGHLPQSSSSRVTAGASDDVAEVRGLGFPGAWVKNSPPKRSRNASAVAVSEKQNRIWNCSASVGFGRGGLGCVSH